MGDTQYDLNSITIMEDIDKYLKRGVPVIDAIVQYAKDEDLEIELLGEIIRRYPSLKSKVYDEAQNLKLVEPAPRLPI